MGIQVGDLYEIASTSKLGSYTLLEIDLLPGWFDFSSQFVSGASSNPLAESVYTRYTREIKLKDIGLSEVFGANIHLVTINPLDNYSGIMRMAEGQTIVDRGESAVNNAAVNGGVVGFNSYPTVGYQTTGDETSLLIGSSDRTAPAYAATKAKLTIVGRK